VTESSPQISRAQAKLEHALASFGVQVEQRICADLGSNVGGFVNCLLQHGARKVYAIETGYGVLDWKLRNDPRVVVMERTNALHVQLQEMVSIVTIDVAWTRQRVILPAARRMLDEHGQIISLIKPHYEANPSLLRKGVLPGDQLDAVLSQVKSEMENLGFQVCGFISSPIKGTGGNVEFLAWLKPRD